MAEDQEMHANSVQPQQQRSTGATLSLPPIRYNRCLMMEGQGQGGGSGWCCYSSAKAMTVLDLIWNVAFVLVSVFVLLSSFSERPSTPLRLWLCGYALQCVLHAASLYFEYRAAYHHHPSSSTLPLSASHCRTCTTRILNWLESFNTIISSIWWVIGFYWIFMGGQSLLQECPLLYWLTVVFLAFDVFFIIFWIGMACIIFFTLFCCIPILAIVYAVAARRGASEDDIRNLPKYRYRESSLIGTLHDYEEEEGFRIREELGSNSSVSELTLNAEDSECCICLSRYLDGAELHILPCNHHFHCGCISKWLRINATCPLCKFNIRRGETLV